MRKRIRIELRYVDPIGAIFGFVTSEPIAVKEFRYEWTARLYEWSVAIAPKTPLTWFYTRRI